MSETWHDSGVITDWRDAQDALGNAWARDRRAVIDEMAREVCPTQWREGGSMRYRGHTITWGEYVTRRHEIEDEEEFTVETWREREFNPTTSSLSHSEAAEVAELTGSCSDGKPCGVPPEDGDDAYCMGCPNYAEDSDDEGPLAQVMREQRADAEAKWRRVDMSARSKYHREITPGVWVDVYAVLAAWDVRNPALQHLIKKALQAGQRGHKTIDEDMDDIVASAERARELVQ